MKLVCLDVEGVLLPEIWINVALKTGIEELKLTTRDISDYSELMNRRLTILKENGLKLKDIQNVIATMNPLEGAVDFLDELRSQTQVILLSDTFSQFASPLMKKLKWPTLFCNTLEIGKDGSVLDFHLRQKDGKRKAVAAFQSTGCQVFASGDSYNDLTMIQTADKSAFFRAPDSIKKENPEIPAFDEYNDLLSEIEKFLA